MQNLEKQRTLARLTASQSWKVCKDDSAISAPEYTLAHGYKLGKSTSKAANDIFTIAGSRVFVNFLKYDDSQPILSFAKIGYRDAEICSFPDSICNCHFKRGDPIPSFPCGNLHMYADVMKQFFRNNDIADVTIAMVKTTRVPLYFDLRSFGYLAAYIVEKRPFPGAHNWLSSQGDGERMAQTLMRGLLRPWDRLADQFINTMTSPIRCVSDFVERSVSKTTTIMLDGAPAYVRTITTDVRVNPFVHSRGCGDGSAQKPLLFPFRPSEGTMAVHGVTSFTVWIMEPVFRALGNKHLVKTIATHNVVDEDWYYHYSQQYNHPHYHTTSTRKFWVGALSSKIEMSSIEMLVFHDLLGHIRENGSNSIKTLADIPRPIAHRSDLTHQMCAVMIAMRCFGLRFHALSSTIRYSTEYFTRVMKFVADWCSTSPLAGLIIECLKNEIIPVARHIVNNLNSTDGRILLEEDSIGEHIVIDVTFGDVPRVPDAPKDMTFIQSQALALSVKSFRMETCVTQVIYSTVPPTSHTSNISSVLRQLSSSSVMSKLRISGFSPASVEYRSPIFDNEICTGVTSGSIALFDSADPLLPDLVNLGDIVVVYVRPAKSTQLLSLIIEGFFDREHVQIILHPEIASGMSFICVFRGKRAVLTTDVLPDPLPEKFDVSGNFLGSVLSAIYDSGIPMLPLVPNILMPARTVQHVRPPWSNWSNMYKSLILHLTKRDVVSQSGTVLSFLELGAGKSNMAKIPKTFESLCTIDGKVKSIIVILVDSDITRARDRLDEADRVETMHKLTVRTMLKQDDMLEYLLKLPSDQFFDLITLTFAINQIDDVAKAINILVQAKNRCRSVMVLTYPNNVDPGIYVYDETNTPSLAGYRMEITVTHNQASRTKRLDWYLEDYVSMKTTRHTDYRHEPVMGFIDRCFVRVPTGADHRSSYLKTAGVDQRRNLQRIYPYDEAIENIMSRFWSFYKLKI